MKRIIKQLCPPILWKMGASIFRKEKNNEISKNEVVRFETDPSQQDLDLYWDEEYVKILEEWGKDHVWNEIQLALAHVNGKVLDIACGSGPTIKILEKYKNLDVHGFDISDLLIKKAISKGISESKLKVNDACKTDYHDNEFEYSFSIGSLEHFTIEGIDEFIKESSRYTKLVSFHMIPVSRSNKDEGWMKTKQSFYNNSESWWLEKFSKYYKNVYPVSSKWEDNWSVGRWFVCVK